MTDYVIHTFVRVVEHKTYTASIRKTGRKTEDGKDELRSTQEDLGWYISFAGSWESYYLGREEPELKVGDEVDIVIRRRRKTG